MISEIDIWRAAQVIRNHGKKAAKEAIARADALAESGDQEGAAVWRRIAAAIEQLQNMTPPAPVH